MTTKQKQEIGQELKALRLNKSLSLRKMAVLMGLRPNTCCSITRIENGDFDSVELVKNYLSAIGYGIKEKYSYKIVQQNKSK